MYKYFETKHNFFLYRLPEPVRKSRKLLLADTKQGRGLLSGWVSGLIMSKILLCS